MKVKKINLYHTASNGVLSMLTLGNYMQLNGTKVDQIEGELWMDVAYQFGHVGITGDCKTMYFHSGNYFIGGKFIKSDYPVTYTIPITGYECYHFEAFKEEFSYHKFNLDKWDLVFIDYPCCVAAFVNDHKFLLNSFMNDKEYIASKLYPE